jgi:hypothetical protein
MRKILFLVIAIVLAKGLYSQNCGIKFIIKDSEDGTLLAEADILEDGNIIKNTSADGSALLTGRSCNRSKFKVAKDGYQSALCFAEAKEAPEENVVRLVNLKRIQANILNSLNGNGNEIGIKQVLKWNEQLTSAYKDNGELEVLKSYKEKLEVAVVKLKDDGVISNKHAKDLLKD